jgi:hypothetical protein
MKKLFAIFMLCLSSTCFASSLGIYPKLAVYKISEGDYDSKVYHNMCIEGIQYLVVSPKYSTPTNAITPNIDSFGKPKTCD